MNTSWTGLESLLWPGVYSPAWVQPERGRDRLKTGLILT